MTDWAVAGTEMSRAVGERLVSRQTCAALRLLSPLKAPGPTVFGFQFFHGPDVELQQDIHAINIRLIYHLLRRGMWTIPGFSAHTGAVGAFPR
jgi:hypothetical protein